MTDSQAAVAIDVDPGRLPAAEDVVRDLIGRATVLAGFGGPLSVAIVDDETMQRINRDFHATDAPTDVLAFPLGEPDAAGGFAAEVVVSLDTALREAAEREVEPLAELLLYVVHGTLHLLGFDDHDEDDARRMHERTLEILAELGLENRIEPEPHD